MNEELTPQKERFLREVEQKLRRRDLDARLLDDGLIHIRWNEKPLCSVDRDGIVRFRPADITGSEVDRKLRTVTQVAAQVKEYEKVNAKKFGFQISLGDGEKKMTDGKNASKQTLLTDAINGCFMSGVGDTSANSIGIAYDAIVTPVSEAVTNTAIASVLFIIAWDAVQ